MSLFTELEYYTATIAAGQSLSAAVPTGDKTLVGIVMPSAWTTAGLSFQVSPDGGTTWDELYYLSAGFASTEYVITGSVASQFIQLDPMQWRGINNLKVRSGPSGSPVDQSAEADITLVVRGVL